MDVWRGKRGDNLTDPLKRGIQSTITAVDVRQWNKYVKPLSGVR